ncbi:MAG: ATP-binding cassette domain-containing protein [Sulfurospirillaceae bacterium]|nr:ATP-binding cassette domain-containing protein [Sulfurospirillaceae bacterium]
MEFDAIKIEVENLTLSYGKRVVFENLSFDIFPRSITALVGPSGIGKSSFLKILNQMIREEEGLHVEGKVLLHNKGLSVDILKLKECELPSLRKKVLYVAQHPDLLPLSIYDNVAFGLRLQGIGKNDINNRIEMSLRDVFLWDEVKERLHVKADILSGGQQQRLILARALAMRPDILLLDEPTASLNEELSLKIEDLLISLKQKMTIVMISHFKEQVKRVADVIFEMRLPS